jgi:hypothetical protein
VAALAERVVIRVQAAIEERVQQSMELALGYRRGSQPQSVLQRVAIAELLAALRCPPFQPEAPLRRVLRDPVR